MSATQDGGTAPRLASAEAVIERLFVLMRLVSSHGAQHPVTAEGAAALSEAIAAAEPPFSLQLVREALFRDEELIPFEIEAYERATALSQACSRVGAHEITFHQAPPANALMGLASVVARAAAGGTASLAGITLPGIAWRAIPGAGWGEEAEAVDPEVAASVQVEMAIREAQRLVGGVDATWSWAVGSSVLRRLERSMRDSQWATDRAIALEPSPWALPRRAVAVVHRCMQLLNHLGVAPSVQRAAAHALLATVCTSFGRIGQPLATSVQQTARRLLGTPGASTGASGAHRLRVCALLHAAGRELQTRQAPSGPAAPFILLLALERMRGATPTGDHIAFHDMLARGLAADHPLIDKRWLGALICATGILPPGAPVLLPNGRAAVVVQPGPLDDPLRPTVQIGAAQGRAPGPVQLLPVTRSA